MSSHLALPREGHMEELFHMFAYMKKHHNAEMVFDPSESEMDESLFPAQDWSFSAYGIEDLKEEMPPNMPKPLGPSMRMRVFQDTDHSGDCITRNRILCVPAECSNLLYVQEAGEFL